MPMSSLLGQPAPSKWVRLNSSIVRSLSRYPDGEAFGVSGLNCTPPNGTTAPGKVLPPAPPGTGLGAVLSSVPMNGLTYWVRLSAACAGGAAIPTAAPDRSSARLSSAARRGSAGRGRGGIWRPPGVRKPAVSKREAKAGQRCHYRGDHDDDCQCLPACHS